MENIQILIYIIIAVCVILAIALVGVLGYVWLRDNKKRTSSTSKDKGEGYTNKSSASSQTKLQGIESMSKFLAFDEVIDSMIVRKNRTQYVMVLQCKGINYDLLGEDEKIAVENGFVQFLNTLKFPIQIYIQSRSLNLRYNIDQYQERLEKVSEDINKIDSQIKREKANGRLDLVSKLEFDKKRKINILEYGVDITNYVARLSQNRNVLQQNTYVAISYYTSEFGGQISNYSKAEIDNIAFSELYTRAQTLISALSSSGVTGKVMTSEELAELLYVAYNRDDSELINIKKAVEAQYDSLYNTAKDIMDKQKEEIENRVNQEAMNLTAKSLSKADRILKLRQENREEIRRRAIAYVEKYKGDMTEELYDETKKQIVKTDITRSDYDNDDNMVQKVNNTETARKTEKTEMTEEEKRRRMARREAMRRAAEEGKKTGTNLSPEERAERMARRKAASTSAEHRIPRKKSSETTVE